MLRSFLLITFRILWRNKVVSFVNVFGLSVSITAFIFIMLYVRHEISYDKFNENYDRIYRLEGDDYAKLPPSIGTHVIDRLPEIKNIARLSAGGKFRLSTISKTNSDDIKLLEAYGFWADSTTFEVFTFPLVQGNPKNALMAPLSMVLSETAARNLFGDADPILKTVMCEGYEFTVTGIMKDIKGSHIEVDVLCSFSSIARVFPDRDTNNAAGNSWLWSATYLLISDYIVVKNVEDKVNVVLSEINDGSLFEIEFERFHLRPMSDLYFKGGLKNLPYGVQGNLKMIHVLIATGIFMLLLAGINYVNLTTARSTTRAKEIAIKRVSGSSANQLRYQIIIESIMVSLISVLVAATFTQMFLEKFIETTGVNIQIDELNSLGEWAAIVGAGCIIGILAGIYPAIYLTEPQPISLIKGTKFTNSNGPFFRSVLMTFQFTLSIIMIACIMVSQRQLQYVKTADIGFNREQIINIATPAYMPEQNTLRETFKERLERNTDIKKVSYSAGLPGGEIPFGVVEVDGIERVIGFYLIDPDYLDVMGIQIVEGRPFIATIPGDIADPKERRVGVLLNEAAVRETGLQSHIGKTLTSNYGQYKLKLEVVGIVKDFHATSLHDKIQPMAFYCVPLCHMANIKVSSHDIPATIESIETEWKKLYPHDPFSYEFLDESFNRQYKSDEQLAIVIGYFSLLAIIIACLGLFALSSFMVSRRRKEIGIRKSMGASVSTIYSMLSWDFVRWILVAVVLACPVAWYLMHLWLQTFAYHISIGLDIFIISALLAIGVALLTITGQSLRAANANPIDSLRYE